MKYYLSQITIWIVFILGASMPVQAHQLGVESVVLEEFGDHEYRISYTASPGSEEANGLPILPSHCQWSEEAESAPSGTMGLVFTSNSQSLSPEDTILLPWKRNGVLFTAVWKNGTQARQFFASSPEGIYIEMALLKASSGNLVQTAKRYTVLGIDHILKGVDHLLFVFGLLLLAKGAKRLALTITAFTVAHSITLALSVLGHARLPSGFVDVVVALSIVFVAVEIIHAQRGRETLSSRYPWLVSFGFGLIHGLGFAGALNALGLPREEIAPALLFFNVGVEIGQLLFVAVWLGALVAARSISLTMPRRLAWAPVYALGIFSSYWFLELTVKMFLL